MIEHLTVTTTCSVHAYQKRPTYSQVWVDRLYAAVKRNLDIPFEFVCFSNDIRSRHYRVESLTTDSWGWWNKLEQFKTGMFTGPVLNLDLDVIVCKNFTDALHQLPRDKILMAKEPHYLPSGEQIANSTIIFWHGNYGFLFERYQQHQHDICEKYSSPTRRMGDQGYIADQTDVGFIDDYLPDNYIAWRHHVTGDKNLDKDPTLLLFTSTQKPSNNLELDLVKNNWI
jgi:hypothetical protein